MAEDDRWAKVDQALGRYYALQGKTDYFNSEGKGKFLVYYDENGFEPDDVDDDIGPNANADDSSFVELDEDFPMKEDLSEEQKIKKIHEILQKCYSSPETAFSSAESLQVDESFFKITKQDLINSEKIYKKQCPTIFNYGMENDESIVRVMAIGLKNKKPYLQYIADMYSRYRALNKTKNVSPGDWVLYNQHLQQLKTIKIPNLPKSKQPFEITQAAVKSFFHRICPKLLFQQSIKIQDSLEQTCEYIAAAIRFINGLAQRQSSSCPFQVDISICFNEVKDLLSSANKPTFSDDEDDDDDDDDDSDPEEDEKALDMIGNIKNKLKTEKLLFNVTEIDDDKKSNKNDGGTRRARVFETQFNNFKMNEIKKKYKGKTFDQYPRRKRFCTFIDRRKKDKEKQTSDKDEVIFYEPPDNCNSFPDQKENSNSYVPEWYFDSSRTTVIPNIGYKKNKGKHGGGDKSKFVNIASTSHAKGHLMLLSFHVDAIDEIRCYIFINGQMSRFLPNDMIGFLPDFFVETNKNKSYAQSEDLQKLVKTLEIPDRKFQAFLNSYQ